MQLKITLAFPIFYIFLVILNLNKYDYHDQTSKKETWKQAVHSTNLFLQ